MNTVHPTIMQSLQPFMAGVFSGGTFTNNPVSDAAKHFDSLVDDYFTTKIEYIGLQLEVEVSVNGLMATQIFSVAGDDLYYEFSEAARSRIARKAIMESGVEI